MPELVIVRAAEPGGLIEVAAACSRLERWSATSVRGRSGLRTYALRAEGCYDRREVVDIILALEALRDPRDDRALLGFLRSPFVGVSDETRLAIARGARRPDWDGLGSVDVDGDMMRHDLKPQSSRFGPTS